MSVSAGEAGGRSEVAEGPRACRGLPLRGAAFVTLVLLVVGCGGSTQRKEDHRRVLRVVDAPRADTPRRDFNPFVTPPLWPARAGIYEPLFIFNRATAEFVPWLATEHRFSPDVRTLTVVLRQGVLWSDGRPFTARDVVATFSFLKRFSERDPFGIAAVLDSAETIDEHTVRLHFQHAYSPALAILAQVPMVPEHRYGRVSSLETFQDPDPVGTGPFTEVRRFDASGYEISRNERYWQPGKPALDAVRLVFVPDDKAAIDALTRGEIDWAGTFIPGVRQSFLAKDPAHNHFWAPPWASPVVLYANLTVRAFAKPEVRKAMSLAIDRSRLIRDAEEGWVSAVDETALPDPLRKWKDPGALKAGGWVAHDPERARQALDAAGLRVGRNGIRQDKDGLPLRFLLVVVGEWVDWARVAAFVSEDLESVGISAKVDTTTFADFADRLYRGQFDLAIAWGGEGATPYHVYRWYLSSNGARPLGEYAFSNFQRFGSPRVDELLARVEATTDARVLRDLNREMQQLFVEQAPVIPLFLNSSWSAYSTKRIVGFPGPQNPYARGAPHADTSELLLVLTELKPAP